jgi:hypothetical protein
MTVQYAINRKSFFPLMVCLCGLLTLSLVSISRGPRPFGHFSYALGGTVAVVAAVWIFASNVAVVRLFRKAPFLALIGVCVILGALLLSQYVSPIRVFGALGLAGVLGCAWFRSEFTTGLVLCALPFLPFPTIAAQVAGVPYIHAISATKEVLLVICAIRMRKNMTWHRRDLLLLGTLVFAAVAYFFHPNAWGLKDDFGFVLAYVAAKGLRIDARKWAKRAIWIVAVVAVIGVVEFAIIGPEPRLLLLGASDSSQLEPSYRAEDFSGVRASSTLSGPLGFAALCAASLGLVAAIGGVVPGGTILLGLICTITRSGWLGAFLVLALAGLKSGKLFRYAAAVLVFALAIGMAVPLLGLTDYVRSSLSGKAGSFQVHAESLRFAYSKVISRPFGSGPGTVGPGAIVRSSSAINVESGYLNVGMQYGVFALFLFIGFCLASFAACWRGASKESLAAALMLAVWLWLLCVGPEHTDFVTGSWVWAAVAICSSGGKES